MKPGNIKDVMDLAKRARERGHRFNPCFVSPPGVGKSEIVQQWCKENGYDFIDIRLAYKEAPDMIGFPQPREVTDKNGTVRQVCLYFTPEIWPTEGKGVIFLDEINRGTTSVMNTCMQLLTDRKIEKYSLPEGWIIAAAINPENEHNDVNTMDTALKDRLEIFEVNYDKKTFVSFMKDSSWDKNIVMFVESNMWSYSKPEDVGETAGNKYLSPRTLSKLNAALKSDIPKDMELDFYEGILGKNVGRAFFQFMNDEQPVLYKDIVKNPAKAFEKLKRFSDPAKYMAGHISLTIKDIVENHDIDDELLVKVILNIPADSGPSLVSELEFKRKDPTLLDRLLKNYPAVKKYFKDVLNK